VLGRVGQRFGDDVVGADLDRLGEPSAGTYLEADRDRGAAGERLEGGVEATVGQDREVDAARGLAQLVQRASGLGDGLVELRAEFGRRRFLRSRRPSETSRCWAPSCRSRSIRCRAWSLAATIRTREAVTSPCASALAIAVATSSVKPASRASVSAGDAPSVIIGRDATDVRPRRNKEGVTA